MNHAIHHEAQAMVTGSDSDDSDDSDDITDRL